MEALHSNGDISPSICLVLVISRKAKPFKEEITMGTTLQFLSTNHSARCCLVNFEGEVVLLPTHPFL